MRPYLHIVHCRAERGPPLDWFNHPKIGLALASHRLPAVSGVADIETERWQLSWMGPAAKGARRWWATPQGRLPAIGTARWNRLRHAGSFSQHRGRAATEPCAAGPAAIVHGLESHPGPGISALDLGWKGRRSAALRDWFRPGSDSKLDPEAQAAGITPWAYRLPGEESRFWGSCDCSRTARRLSRRSSIIPATYICR